jgi:hypothetical protein
MKELTLLFKVILTCEKSGEPEVVTATTFDPIGSALRKVGAVKIDC